MSSGPAVRSTPIEGLLVVDLPLHGDTRGWFKENWQREKMVALGLPDFEPVQNNVSYNATAGATRGIHAEPWDKYISVASGRVFGAWVDLRPGPGFGTTVTVDLHPGVAVFVPRGVGNSYQALEDGTTYAYLVNEHWRPDVVYTAVALDDPALGIDWPIPIADAEVSDKDRANPLLADVTPMEPRRALILGAYGQLGRALRAALPDADAVDLDTFDMTDPAAYAGVDWTRYDTVVNAAAYTAVDAAETDDGRRDAWAANVTALGHLARVARRHRLTVAHVSSDYVFDGTHESHDEEEPFSPLGVYGQTKAAGDAVIATLDRHYVVRTSWVIGDGGKAASLIEAFTRAGKTVLKASMVPHQDRRWLGVLPVIGFAGIARPEKFFATLRDNGARLIDTRSYPDHYRYGERQARSLLKEAKDYNAMLVTTEKDYVRLPDEEDSARGELKHRCRPFLVAVEFADVGVVKELLAARLTQSARGGSRGSA